MKILIAIDGSEFSDAALAEYCRLFGTTPDHEVKLISVYEDAQALSSQPFALPLGYYQDVIDSACKQANDAVDKAVRFITEKLNGTCPHISRDLPNGIPAQQIVEVAREWKANLIIVGSHGRGFWGRMLGSVSDGVVHHAPCSVLIVRGKSKGSSMPGEK